LQVRNGAPRWAELKRGGCVPAVLVAHCEWIAAGPARAEKLVSPCGRSEVGEVYTRQAGSIRTGRRVTEQASEAYALDGLQPSFLPAGGGLSIVSEVAPERDVCLAARHRQGSVGYPHSVTTEYGGRP